MPATSSMTSRARRATCGNAAPISWTQPKKRSPPLRRKYVVECFLPTSQNGDVLERSFYNEIEKAGGLARLFLNSLPGIALVQVPGRSNHLVLNCGARVVACAV